MTHRYTVEFRIFGDTLHPSTVTRELGLQPCQVCISGQSRFAGRIDTGMWAYNGTDGDTPDWDSLAQGLEFVLDKLWPYREQIARYRTVGELVWWCGHFQSSFDGGPTLPADLLARLGEFGAELYIDCYFSPPDVQPTLVRASKF